MAPAVGEMNRAGQVRQERRKATRPPPAAAWSGPALAPGQREHVPREGEERRQPNRPVAAIHATGHSQP